MKQIPTIAPAAANPHAALLRPLPTTRAEHISLESEPDPSTPLREPQRAICASFTLSTPLRGWSTRVAVLEGHFAAVHSVRPHGAPLDYVLDLRFAASQPVRVRRIAWIWLSCAMALLALSVLALWSTRGPLPMFLLSPGFGIALAALLGMIGALLKFTRGTTESLQFLSEHGGAVLISITGGIGSTRRGKRFFVELIKSIRAAKQQRPQPKAQWLRDEMREHHRLRELQVLSAADYEVSKTRILKAHS